MDNNVKAHQTITDELKAYVASLGLTWIDTDASSGVRRFNYIEYDVSDWSLFERNAINYWKRVIYSLLLKVQEKFSLSPPDLVFYAVPSVGTATCFGPRVATVSGHEIRGAVNARESVSWDHRCIMVSPKTKYLVIKSYYDDLCYDDLDNMITSVTMALEEMGDDSNWS